MLVAMAALLAACGQTEAQGPTVDHAKLSAELESRAVEIEAAADESVKTVERELAGEIEAIRAAEAKSHPVQDGTRQPD